MFNPTLNGPSFPELHLRNWCLGAWKPRSQHWPFPSLSSPNPWVSPKQSTKSQVLFGVILVGSWFDPHGSCYFLRWVEAAWTPYRLCSQAFRQRAICLAASYFQPQLYSTSDLENHISNPRDYISGKFYESAKENAFLYTFLFWGNKKISTTKEKLRNDDSLEKGLWGIECPQNGRVDEKWSPSLHNSINAYCCAIVGIAGLTFFEPVEPVFRNGVQYVIRGLYVSSQNVANTKGCWGSRARTDQATWYHKTFALLYTLWNQDRVGL